MVLTVMVRAITRTRAAREGRAAGFPPGRSAGSGQSPSVLRILEGQLVVDADLGGEPHSTDTGFGFGGDEVSAAAWRVGDAGDVVVGVEQLASTLRSASLRVRTLQEFAEVYLAIALRRPAPKREAVVSAARSPHAR
ncbi:hypothetical protein ACIOZL_28910 [Streptomyces sp. NPDC087769]|uniref:hypothetical protein n=1 Tax=unclassified Streptomyces TaxID=2593676 RepID=UPI003712765F